MYMCVCIHEKVWVCVFAQLQRLKLSPQYSNHTCSYADLASSYTPVLPQQQQTLILSQPDDPPHPTNANTSSTEKEQEI